MYACEEVKQTCASVHMANLFNQVIVLNKVYFISATWVASF